MDSLEKTLKKCDKNRIVLIAVDGIFSMEGDVVNLPEIVALARKYKASIFIDDAHGIGVLGQKGRGTASHFGLTNEVEMIMGTLSKSLGSTGGFIAANKETINYLKHNARSLIFSAGIAPVNAAIAIAALDLIESEPERISRLWDNARYAINLLRAEGFDTGNSITPIIPILIRDDIKNIYYDKITSSKWCFCKSSSISGSA